MHIATTLVIILAAGMASQVLAARLRIPAIVVLIAAGLTLGPFTGLVDPQVSEVELSELIGLGVAVILFEGGMDLRIREFRRVGHGVGRLTILGPPVAMALGATAAHYIAGFSWPVALVTGAILVVTGPTVIGPLLRQAKIDRDSSALLKWEGIVNDPIGVLLAVLTFQYFALSQEGFGGIVEGFALAIGAAAVLGGLGGWLTGIVFQRGWIPPHLKSPLLLALVLVFFVLANAVQSEAGLLTVTVMGLVMGNMKLPERERLLDFKESLTVVLLSVLFIIIPATLDSDDLRALDWRIVLFVVALLFLVRPLTIALVTIGAPMRWQDKVLLGWIAPRGIVAAATAGLFGPAMVAVGYEDGALLLPTVFAVILVTVLVHGFTLAPLARALGLSQPDGNGLLIVGASPFTEQFADALHRLDVAVKVADGSYQRLQPLRMANVPVYYGEVLSEDAEERLDGGNLTYLLCASDNDYYNALVSRSLGPEFGHHRTFQLATHEESSHEDRRLTVQRRGSPAFDGVLDYFALHARLGDGWRVHTTKLTDEFGHEQLFTRLGTLGEDWVFLASVTRAGGLRIYGKDHAFTPEAGSTVLYFAPATAKRALADE